MHPTAFADGLNVAILLPCHNQAVTIAGMVRGFAEALPSARVYVFDNSSTDDTARLATRGGAIVRREAIGGHGGVVRRMFADVEADVYVLADPAGGYDPADAPSLVNALITERVDMVVGTRESASADRALDRSFHWLYRRFFGGRVSDIGSGYRAFTRRFVKSFPAIASGFDVEVELSMHASQLMIPVAEIPVQHRVPEHGSKSDTIGPLRAMQALGLLLREGRPFLFYAPLAVCLWVVGILLLAPSLASGSANAHALAGMALLVAGFILAGCGLVLDALGRSRIEQKRVLFLTVPSLGGQ